MSYILYMTLVGWSNFVGVWLYDYLYFVSCMYWVWIVQLEYSVWFFKHFCSSTHHLLPFWKVNNFAKTYSDRHTTNSIPIAGSLHIESKSSINCLSKLKHLVEHVSVKNGISNIVRWCKINEKCICTFGFLWHKW